MCSKSDVSLNISCIFCEFYCFLQINGVSAHGDFCTIGTTIDSEMDGNHFLSNVAFHIFSMRLLIVARIRQVFHRSRLELNCFR